MLKLKSYFVTTYLMMAATIMLVALYELISRGLHLTWLGALVTTLPFVGYYAWISYRKDTPRSHPHLPILTGITGLGLILAIYGYAGDEEHRNFGIAAAVLGALGFLLFVYWYSIFNRGINSKLTKGQPLPPFVVHRQDGETVTSATLLGTPALLIFYRGNWCPICVAQVKEVTSRYRELIKRGVQVVLISPQPHDLTRRVAGLYEVPFQFWVDVDNAAARTLDILNADGVPAGLKKKYGPDTVLPTVIIVDPEGKILFTHQTNNYRIRPNPDLFMEVLAAHGY